jgi:hypothetical protein
MSEAQYLFRLDDACPWMDADRWGTLEKLFDRYGVKPVVAIIPECRDPGVRPAPEDPKFWVKARAWQAKGWTIALHGFDHVYVGTAGGLVPLNRQTEFAGQPEAVQRQKIRDGWAALRARGLEPTVWVAPSHTFDRTTLKVLEEETSIRIVSDGLATSPFRRLGFSWIPQQMWRPRVRPSGVWTICLHPNTIDATMPDRIEAFLKTQALQVVAINDLLPVTRKWGWGDAAFGLAFLGFRNLRTRVKHFLGRGRR